MPNNTEVKSNRERYTERLKAKYPDREFADDEALFGQINDDYDGYDKELSGYKEREKHCPTCLQATRKVPLSLLTGEKAKTLSSVWCANSGMISRPHLKTPKAGGTCSRQQGICGTNRPRERVRGRVSEEPRRNPDHP